MLRQRAISATLWSGADTLLRQGLQFGVTMIMARLLTPGEFGTVALLYLFLGLASAFTDGGLSAALVQQQSITETDTSTVFWFNLAMGAAMALLVAALSPSIANFYRLPVLSPLAKVMALNLLIGALGTVHSTLFVRQLDFKTPMKIGAAASALSGVLAIAAAWLGYGVWSLVIQALSSTIVTTTLLWTFGTWRPRLEASVESARKLFGYGGYLFVAGLLDVTYNRAYTLLLGKMQGVSELAYYNRADGTKQLPVGVLSSILSRVALPVFSSAAMDKERLRRGVQQALRALMLVNSPMMLGLMVTADPIVVTLFGSQWAPSAPILRILCLAGLLWPLHVVNLNALMAQGYSNLFFRLEVAKKIIGVSLLVAGSAFGVLGIAWSQVAFGVAAFFINSYYTRIHLRYGALQQLRDIAPSLTLAGSMALILGLGASVFKGHPHWMLLFQVPVGAMLFLLGCWTFQIAAFRDALAALRSYRTQ